MSDNRTRTREKAAPDEYRAEFARRARELVSKMTLSEKISQMSYQSAAVPRLGIPEYNWWNECLHGVARAGIATVFPQAIGMASSFDAPLLETVASKIADEARAKHHESVRRGDRRIYKGLTFWTPNVNIFRDPRWGRGQETYGEDPHLSSVLGVAFVKGLQGDDPKYLKLVATPKHFAAHSGPEAVRHHFDTIVSPKELRETYLPAFKACIVEGGAASIMGAYTRLNGEPCCASPTLLGDILREEWGFEGYVVSDCGAIGDIHRHHKVTTTMAESAALAVNNGCDLCCGYDYAGLCAAVEEGLISEETITRSVELLMEARFRLGMFDPPEEVPYAQIPYEVNDCEEHRALALEAARESLVLLKNESDILPFGPEVRSIGVIGPNADNHRVLLGNYNGLPSRSVTLLEGIRTLAPAGTTVRYAPGSELVSPPGDGWGRADDDEFSEACSVAERSDVVVLCLGISPTLEGEEGDALHSESQGDRVSIGLPDVQERLLRTVAGEGKPIVLVLLSGSAIAFPEADEAAAAVLLGWYPGEEGGTAVAEALFGAYNPAGRLPVTFVRSVDDLPPFTDYSMAGRTYRYLTTEPLYPFGYGLSYTSFRYSGITLSAGGRSAADLAAGEEITVRAVVENSGTRAGDEVVQLYVSDLEASFTVPHHSLQGFSRIHLAPGERTEVSFRLTARRLALIADDGRCLLEPGRFRLFLGGSQPDERSRSLTATAPLSIDLEVTGEIVEVSY